MFESHLPSPPVPLGTGDVTLVPASCTWLIHGENECRQEQGRGELGCVAVLCSAVLFLINQLLPHFGADGRGISGKSSAYV
jgi:hypothetical protein